MKKTILYLLSFYLVAGSVEMVVIKFLANYDTGTGRILSFASEAREELSKRYTGTEMWDFTEEYCHEYERGFLSYHLCATPLYDPKCPSPIFAIGLVRTKPIFFPEPGSSADRLLIMDEPVARVDWNNEICP